MFYLIQFTIIGIVSHRKIMHNDYYVDKTNNNRVAKIAFNDKLAAHAH